MNQTTNTGTQSRIHFSRNRSPIDAPAKPFLTQATVFLIVLSPALSAGIIPILNTSVPVTAIALLFVAPGLLILSIRERFSIRSTIDRLVFVYAAGVALSGLLGEKTDTNTLVAIAVLFSSLIVARSWAVAVSRGEPSAFAYWPLFAASVVIAIIAGSLGEFSPSDGRFSVPDSGLSTSVISRSVGYGVILSFSGLLVQTRQRWQLPSLAVLVSLLTVVALAGSRSALTGLIAALILMTLMRASTRRIIRSSGKRLLQSSGLLTRIGTFLLLVSMIALVTLNNRVTSSIIGYLSNPSAYATLSGRTDLWSIALRQFRSSPFTGLGYGQTSRALEGLDVWGQETIAQAHNVLVESLMTTGLLGTVPLIAILFWVTWNLVLALRVSEPRNPQVFVSSVGLLIFALVRSLTEGAMAQAGSVDVLVFFLATFGLQASNDRRITPTNPAEPYSRAVRKPSPRMRWHTLGAGRRSSSH